MTNIQITKEQAKAIEELRKQKRHNTWDYIAKRRSSIIDPFSKEYKPFNDMKLEDIISAFYEGYEVIEVIEKDKFVKSIMTGNIYQVEDVENAMARLKGIVCKPPFNFSEYIKLSNLELISEEEVQQAKEIQFWKKLGREVNELREGDTVHTEMDNVYRIISDDKTESEATLKISNAKKWLSDDWSKGARIDGLYPAESFVSFEELKK